MQVKNTSKSETFKPKATKFYFPEELLKSISSNPYSSKSHSLLTRNNEAVMLSVI